MEATAALIRLGEQKTAMLARLEAWPAQLRGVKPAAGEWSALEVLDHLVRTESGITRYATDGLRCPKKVGARDRLGFLLAERVFLSRRKVKVPAGAPVLPGEALDFSEIRVRWDKAREQLARTVEEAREGYDPKLSVFQHPASGWMTLDQVLRFFSVHIAHHEFQIQRIRTKLDGLAG